MSTAPKEPSLADVITQRLQQDDIEVPMLPEVANKVIRLTNDPESNAGDLANLIQSDQTLAGHVMRIANSALYSPNTSLVSLQQAITRLGMQVIADIALAACVNSKMFKTPGYEQHIQTELQFSLMAGLWAKEIARTCRRNVEAAFLTGLLHDIGRPVCVQIVIETAAEFDATVAPHTMFKLEHHFQRAIGISVVRQWEMPTLVCDVITWFDDYANAGKNSEQTMIAVAGAEFARRFYKGTPLRKKIDHEALINSPVLADLNLYPEDVDKLIEKEEVITSAMEAMSQ